MPCRQGAAGSFLGSGTHTSSFRPDFQPKSVGELKLRGSCLHGKPRAGWWAHSPHLVSLRWSHFVTTLPARREGFFALPLPVPARGAGGGGPGSSRGCWGCPVHRSSLGEELAEGPGEAPPHANVASVGLMQPWLGPVPHGPRCSLQGASSRGCAARPSPASTHQGTRAGLEGTKETKGTHREAFGRATRPCLHSEWELKSPLRMQVGSSVGWAAHPLSWGQPLGSEGASLNFSWSLVWVQQDLPLRPPKKPVQSRTIAPQPLQTALGSSWWQLPGSSPIPVQTPLPGYPSCASDIPVCFLPGMFSVPRVCRLPVS